MKVNMNHPLTHNRLYNRKGNYYNYKTWNSPANQDVLLSILLIGGTIKF